MKIIEVLLFVVGHEEDIKFFISTLTKIAEKADHVYKLVRNELGPILQKIKSLPIEEKDLKDQQQQCKRALATAITKARTLVNNVRMLFDYADLEADKACSMKESFRSGPSRIVNYTEQIKRYLERSQKSYTEFRTKYDEGIDICREVAAKCATKQEEAKSLKIGLGTTGGVAGGVSGVAGVAAGVAALGVAITATGPATLGVGTIVGGTIAAGAGVVAVGATAVSVGAITLAVKFGKLQKSFSEIIKDLEEITDDLDELSFSMEALNEMLETTSQNTDDVLAYITKHHNDFCVTFDVLLDGIRVAHGKLPQEYL